MPLTTAYCGTNRLIVTYPTICIHKFFYSTDATPSEYSHRDSDKFTKNVTRPDLPDFFRCRSRVLTSLADIDDELFVFQDPFTRATSYSEKRTKCIVVDLQHKTLDTFTVLDSPMARSSAQPDSAVLLNSLQLCQYNVHQKYETYLLCRSLTFG